MYRSIRGFERFSVLERGGSPSVSRFIPADKRMEGHLGGGREERRCSALCSTHNTAANRDKLVGEGRRGRGGDAQGVAVM